MGVRQLNIKKGKKSIVETDKKVDFKCRPSILQLPYKA